MVLTRWSRNSGAPVTPVDASIWSGSLTLPVIASTLDVNVHTLIDADLGAVFLGIPYRVLVGVKWRMIPTLSIINPSSKSIFQSNPPRRKLGVATYAQGIYAFDSEPINYTNCVLKEQGFLFLERTGEPSLDAITVPDVPESRDYFVNTSVASTGSAGNTSNNFGCTRGQLYFEPGILGFVEVKYVAVLIFTAIPDLGASFTISQL